MIRRAARTSLALHCDHPTLSERIERCLADLPVADDADVDATIVVRRRGDADGAVHDLYLESRDGSVEDLGTGLTGVQVLRLVAWVVSRQARRSVQHLPVLHAAVVAGESGAVVLCGGSQTGKSTLTVACVASGLHYLSDDMAILDVGAATVEPFARPIMLREGGRRLLADRAVLPESGGSSDAAGETFVTAGEVGRVATTALPVVGVGVITRADVASVMPLSRAATLQTLVSHCVTLDVDGAARFADLARMAENCPGWAVAVDPELQVVDQLVELVGGSSASA